MSLGEEVQRIMENYQDKVDKGHIKGFELRIRHRDRTKLEHFAELYVDEQPKRQSIEIKSNLL